MKKLTKESYKNLELLDQSFNVSLNTIKLNVNNSLEHELAKFFCVWEALKNGNVIVTEAIFKNHKRADIFDLEHCEAVEIVCSETDKSIAKKKKEYPCKVMFLKAPVVINYWINKGFKDEISNK